MTVTEMGCVLHARVGPGTPGAPRDFDALVAGSGGRLLTTTGAGAAPGTAATVAAVFTSASAALECALALQRGALRRGEGRRPGVGVAGGDLALGDGRADGAAAADAAELARRAEPGQILVTAVVPLLLGGGAHRFVSAGELNGVLRERPVALWELVPGDDGDDRRAALAPLPPALRQEASLPYVARPAATAALAQAWAAARHGARQVVLVSGEAGAGKSRLVAELARTAYDEGAQVLFGSCSPEVDLPFQPFVEALRHPLDALDVAARRRLAGPGAADLALLLPRLGLAGPSTRDGTAGTTTEVDAETRRYWMFEAVVDVLENLSRRAPVLVVLDDLHWARPSTALLLAHLLDDRRLCRLCIVGTHRSGAEDLSGPFQEVLAELPRFPAVCQVAIDGLEAGAVRELVTRLVGHHLDDGLETLVARLVGLTDGNPFLIGELWHQLVEDGELRRHGRRWSFGGGPAPLRSPTTLRALIGRRLARLGPPARALLPLGAIAGGSFDLATVARAGGLDVGTASAALDEAVRAQLLVEAGGGQYRFRHLLISQVLQDGLSAGERGRAHLALAEAVEALAPERYDVLAHHYALAVPLAAPEVAARWARRAAARSLDAKAYDDAAATLDEALAGIERPDLRADLLLDLAAVATQSGDTETSLRASDEAATLAHRAGDRARLVAAGLRAEEALCRCTHFSGPPTDLLDRALAAADDDVSRARLLGAISTAHAFSGREADGVAVGDEAIALARRTGDAPTLGNVMHSSLFAGWLRPGDLERQLALAEEGAALARRLGNEDLELRMVTKVSFGLFVTGAGARLRHVLDEHGRLARRVRQPWLLAANAASRSALALGEGRLAQAEEAADEFERWSSRLAIQFEGYGIMMFAVRREQGRLAELRPMAELVARLGRDRAAWLPGLAALYAEVGLLEECRDLLDRAGADGFAVPADNVRTLTLSYLADACAATAHPAAAAIYRQLEPWAGRAVSSPALACYGSADRYLGKLAEASGRTVVAGRHYEAALRFDEAAGWDGWAAHSRFALGHFLVAHGRAAEAERGRAALGAALREARASGLVALAQRCEAALTTPAPTANGTLVALTPRETEILRLIAGGRTNREVGDLLHTSQHTVANQVHSILLKTGCANRTEAIAWAHRARLLD